MKNFVWLAWSVVISSALLLTGCRKAADPVPNVTPSTTPDTSRALQLHFQSVVNGMPLVLDSAWYRNAAGDSFRVTNYRYYVSNFTLEAESGETVSLPETYLLIDGGVAQTRTINPIPAGTYQKISFLIGVDSAHNVNGANSGDLSQASGMYWDWNSGYVMAKLEGFSPQSTIAGKSFGYHIGGYSGKNNALRRVNLSLPSPLKITNGNSPTLFVQSDIGSWFSGATTFSIRDVSSVMNLGKEANAIADNYSKGFSVVRVAP